MKRTVTCGLFVLGLLVVAGGGCKGTPGTDMGADLATEDLSTGVRDLSGVQPDLTTPPPADLATADLTTPPPADLAAADLTTPPPADLAMADLTMPPPPDLSMPLDFATPPDLSTPRDFATPPDLTTPRDLATPPDLSTPRDMVTSPDMGLVCNSSASCGAGKFCCADFTLGPGSAPMCPLVSFSVACTSSCNGNIALSCNVTDRARLCGKAADCAGDPGNYRNCCPLNAGGTTINMCVTDLIKLGLGVTCLP